MKLENIENISIGIVTSLAIGVVVISTLLATEIHHVSHDKFETINQIVKK